MEVDKERRRVSLTMVRPGSERPRGRNGVKTARGASLDGGAVSGAVRRGDRPPSVRARPPGGRPQGQQADLKVSSKATVRRKHGRPQGAAHKAADPIKAAVRTGGSQGGPAARAMADKAADRARVSDAATARPPPRGPRYAGSGPSRPREFKPKPGPITPISDAMKKGKEPMRTFGDLMQFFGGKDDEKKKPRKRRPNKEARSRGRSRPIRRRKRYRPSRLVPCETDAKAKESSSPPPRRNPM